MTKGRADCAAQGEAQSDQGRLLVQEWGRLATRSATEDLWGQSVKPIIPARHHPAPDRRSWKELRLRQGSATSVTSQPPDRPVIATVVDAERSTNGRLSWLRRQQCKSSLDPTQHLPRVGHGSVANPRLKIGTQAPGSNSTNFFRRPPTMPKLPPTQVRRSRLTKAQPRW